MAEVHAKTSVKTSSTPQVFGINAVGLDFYDALANNEEAVREMGDETLRKIAKELAEKSHQYWAVR